MITKYESTKKLARMVELPVAELNDIARDLDIEMTYDATNHTWRIVGKADAQMLVDMLSEKF